LPFYAASGLMDVVRPEARLPFEDDVNPPQLQPFFGEHAASYHVVVAATGALLYRQRGDSGQKVEVCLEAAGLFLMNNLLNSTLYTKITDGIDLVTNKQARFPFKNYNIDKNPSRIHGGILIPGLQAYQCADGLWVNLLELDLMEPLDRIQNALDKRGASTAKRAAISAALFHWGPIVERLIMYIQTYRTSYAVAMKAKPRPDVIHALEDGGIRHIPVSNLGDAPNHPQVVHLGLLRDGSIASPFFLHGGCGKPSMSAPDLGEHSTFFF